LNAGTPSSSTNPYSLPTDDEGTDDEDFPEDQESKQEEEMPPASSTVKDRRGAPVGPHAGSDDDDAAALQTYLDLTAAEYAEYLAPGPTTSPTSAAAVAPNQRSTLPAGATATPSSLQATESRLQDEDDQTPPESGYTTPTHHNMSDPEPEEVNVDEQLTVAGSTSLGQKKRALSPHKSGADSPQKPVQKKTYKQPSLTPYFSNSNTI
jgi:hypothetical protein